LWQSQIRISEHPLFTGTCYHCQLLMCRLGACAWLCVVDADESVDGTTWGDCTQEQWNTWYTSAVSLQSVVLCDGNSHPRCQLSKLNSPVELSHVVDLCELNLLIMQPNSTRHKSTSCSARLANNAWSVHSWWRGVVGNAFRLKRSYSTQGPVSTAMGDCLRAGRPSRCEVCQLDRLSLLPSMGW